MSSKYLQTVIKGRLDYRLWNAFRFLHGYDISGKMRSILIDWLVQVHMRFHLLQETLYLTVAILDRFLQVKPTPIQLLFKY